MLAMLRKPDHGRNGITVREALLVYEDILILALSDHHPYWSAQEKPFPRQKRLSRLLYAEMLIQQGEQGAFAYVPAVYNKNVLGHFVEKYGKFVYSTKFAFSVAHSCENLVEAAPDSMLAFVLEGEQQVYVRRRSIRYGVETDHIWSEWSPVRGISVRTEICRFRRAISAGIRLFLIKVQLFLTVDLRGDV